MKYNVYEYMFLSIKFIQFCVPFIQFIHLRWNELFDSACLISAGRLFQIRGPEYDILRLKISLFGLGGISLIEVDNLRAKLVDLRVNISLM